MRLSALVSAACLSLSCTAFAAVPATEKGGVLVGPKGMTLYTYSADGVNQSACNDECAKAWPPLSAVSDMGDTSDWIKFEREDGSMQWAYKGKPLYTYVKDKKPGDMSGDGKGGKWKVAKP